MGVETTADAVWVLVHIDIGNQAPVTPRRRAMLGERLRDHRLARAVDVEHRNAARRPKAVCQWAVGT
jgi:hypothetical protein